MLKIAIIDAPPLAYDCVTTNLNPTPACPRPGIDSEILGFTLSYLKIPYKLIPYKGRVDYGSFRNGTWGGLLGLVLNGTIDTICASYGHLSLRAKYFDFTYPVLQDEPTMVVRKSTPTFFSGALLTFRVFDFTLWMTIFWFFGLFVSSLVLARKVMYGQNSESTTYTLWFFFRYAIRQCKGRVRESSYAGNLLSCLLGICGILLLGLYQTCLLGKLMHPGDVRPFKDFEEMTRMIENKQLTMVHSRDPDHHWWWYFQQMKTSNLSYYQRMRQVLAKNPVMVEPDTDKIHEMIETGLYVYPTSAEAARFLTNTRCKLTAVPAGEDLPRRWGGYIFKKGSKWISILHEPLIITQQHSRSVWEKYLSLDDKHCTNNHNPTPHGDPLSIVSLSGVLLLLIIGLVCATTVYFVERDNSEFPSLTIAFPDVMLTLSNLYHDIIASLTDYE